MIFEVRKTCGVSYASWKEKAKNKGQARIAQKDKRERPIYV